MTFASCALATQQKNKGRHGPKMSIHPFRREHQAPMSLASDNNLPRSETRDHTWKLKPTSQIIIYGSFSINRYYGQGLTKKTKRKMLASHMPDADGTFLKI